MYPRYIFTRSFRNHESGERKIIGSKVKPLRLSYHSWTFTIMQHRSVTMVDSAERIAIDEHSDKENLPLPRKIRREAKDSAPTVAMKLNNKGASCIQCSDYKQAIFLLSRALKITEEMSHDHIIDCTPCDCYHYKHESCRMNDPLPSTAYSTVARYLLGAFERENRNET